MQTWISIIALIGVALLAWNLLRRFGTDRIAQLNDRRRPTSRIVSRGEYVDGNRHLDVALSLSTETFFYENADMNASVDLQFIREVEYDNELATGAMVADGKVLRLRSSNQTFEFVLPKDSVAAWNLMLPPRRGAEA
jgi:hypothetical protein